MKMASLKCTNCQLVNFATETNCIRCGAPLAGGAQAPEAGQQLSDASFEAGYAPAWNQDQPSAAYPNPQAPYAFPPPPFAAQGDGVWRDGSTLVMYKQAQLPDRCVKCNEHVGGERLKRKLYWHHPALFLILLVAVLIYAIVAMIVRKEATIYVGICERHRARRRNAIIIGWSLVVLSIISFVVAISNNEPVYALVGAVLFLIGVIYGTLVARVVRATKMDDHYVWLAGVNQEYLNMLPQMQRH
jgi:hypothetical protein